MFFSRPNMDALKMSSYAPMPSTLLSKIRIPVCGCLQHVPNAMGPRSRGKKALEWSAFSFTIAGTLACATLEQAASELHCVAFVKQHFQVLARAPSGPKRRSPGEHSSNWSRTWLHPIPLKQHVLCQRPDHLLGAPVMQCAESVLVPAPVRHCRALDTSPRRTF